VPIVIHFIGSMHLLAAAQSSKCRSETALTFRLCTPWVKSQVYCFFGSHCSFYDGYRIAIIIQTLLPIRRL